MSRRLYRRRRGNKLTHHAISSSSLLTDINPKPSSISRRGSPKTYGGQMSDPESVKTEEFERHFRGLMVKQVAGVPVRNFDAVTIVSDLDSVRTTDVYRKFQDALHRGDHSGKGMYHRQYLLPLIRYLNCIPL